jgi:hypothetical protein
MALYSGRFKYISKGKLHDPKVDPHELNDISSSQPQDLLRLQERMDEIGTKGELYDLEADPHELNDISSSQPQDLLRLQERIYEIDRDLRVQRQKYQHPRGEKLTKEEKERLKALGYL